MLPHTLVKPVSCIKNIWLVWCLKEKFVKTLPKDLKLLSVFHRFLKFEWKILKHSTSLQQKCYFALCHWHYHHYWCDKRIFTKWILENKPLFLFCCFAFISSSIVCILPPAGQPRKRFHVNGSPLVMSIFKAAAEISVVRRNPRGINNT